MVPTHIELGLAFWPIMMILLHAAESRLHYFIILDSGSSNHANRKWHVWFVIIWSMTYVILFGITGEWQPLAIGALSRFAIFPMLLNYHRGKPQAYVGVNGIDSFLRLIPLKNRLRLFWFTTLITIAWAINWSFSVLFNGR